jgi:hypothetical protein
MTLLEILPEVRRLSINERLILLEALTRSVREDLSASQKPEDVVPFVSLHGALKPDGPMPSDEELRDDYVDYLIKKYA